MSLRRAIGAARTLAEAPHWAAPSPWADDSHLHTVTWDELYPGMAGIPCTRAEAMAVPAVARARHMIVTTVARMPLTAWRDGAALAEQPVWTYRTDGAQSAQARMKATVDDLIFHGESLWVADRDAEWNVNRATHVPYARWSVEIDGDKVEITIDNEIVPAARAIHIPGLHEGILSFGAATIRGASRTMAAAVDAAEHPLRLELHDTGDYPMPVSEARELVADARDAMRDGVGVLFTPPNVESRLHAVDTGALVVDGRESFAVDIARVMGVPSAVIDAHSRGATMTYQNTRDVVVHFLHLGVVTYMAPITARLSLDDVSPRGTELRFDAETILGPAELLTDAAPRPTPESEPVP